MQKASLLAGMAFTRAYVGYVHAVAHSLGGFYGVPHGLANAVLDAYGEKVYKKLAELADAVGIKGDSDEVKAKAFIQAIKDMNASMDIPTKIQGKWTIKEEDIPTMVERAAKEANPLSSEGFFVVVSFPLGTAYFRFSGLSAASCGRTKRPSFRTSTPSI